MRPYVLGLEDLDNTKGLVAGGKAAGLGELFKIEGIHVPEGFCVTADAFVSIMKEVSSIQPWLDSLARLQLGDRVKIAELSGEIRRRIEMAIMPQDICEAITCFLTRFDEKTAFAVRSSATAEDLPTASFAGQQETYLNIVGREAVLKQISKCWASLFTERAVTYRIQNGFDHRKVHMAVVVQKMVFPQAAGTLFTADPISCNRKVLSVDASFGLGEALVSGLVNADHFKVRQGRIVERKISAKKRGVFALKEGGTKPQEIPPEQQNSPALTEDQVLQLERIGRRIENHFGSPQDIEWCLADEVFYVVQSRPITTLFPIPEVEEQAQAQENHIYVSVGHQQMMTDPMKPLGISFFLLTTPAPMRQAGGRLFVDVTQMLVSPESRTRVLNALGQSDPLIRDALITVLERGDFIQVLPEAQNQQSAAKGGPAISKSSERSQIEKDPTLVSEFIRRSQISIEALKQNIQKKSGSELFEFIQEDLQALKRFLFDPESLGVIKAAMEASSWINENMERWLGEKNAADALSQSVTGNITSEMGLALLDVADAIRPYSEVIDYLKHFKEDDFWEELIQLEGGKETRDAVIDFLDQYGMRCVGEIDITKTRWSEKPTALVPLILSNLKNFDPRASQLKFEQGHQAALKKEQDLLERLKSLPEGQEKVHETKRRISLIRNFSGYREYPKYSMIQRYFVYKQALLKEAETLRSAGVIHEKEEIYFLTFQELHEVVRTHELDDSILRQRKEAFNVYETLKPPRVITSEGEVFSGAYRRDHLPAGALVGLAVSSGVVEGRARVILNIEEADLEVGDILITSYTDPSWTPLFVSIKGLVTEVGGLMTHGSVIAREYGLPAVVGVENATTRIKDGQRIRIHGTEGYVELL